jgi:hypothetical protein
MTENSGPTQGLNSLPEKFFEFPISASPTLPRSQPNWLHIKIDAKNLVGLTNPNEAVAWKN